MIDIGSRLLASPSGRVVTKSEVDRMRCATEAAKHPLFPERRAVGLFGSKDRIERREPPAGHTALSDLYSAQRSAEERAQEESRRRLERLSPAVQAYRASDLPLRGREALDVVYRRCKAAGGEPVVLPRADLADAIGVTPAEAESLLDTLERIGAVVVSRAFGRPLLVKPSF